MTIKDFCITCNTNTLDLAILDINNDCIFEGMLYMVFHNPNEELDDKLIYWNKVNTSEELMKLEIESWEMNNDDSITIYTNYE